MMFDTDSKRLPAEAYAVELRNMRLTIDRVWCAVTRCKSPVGCHGHIGGGEAELCDRCEAERLAEHRAKKEASHV